MKYLLDTNTCIYLIKKKSENILRKLRQKNIDDVAVSVVTLSELVYGVEKSLYPSRNLLALTEFIAPLKILTYDEHAAFTYGKIRAALEKAGALIGPLDMQIAAHAASVSAILVTNNEREFKRIPKLKIENWL